MWHNAVCYVSKFTGIGGILQLKDWVKRNGKVVGPEFLSVDGFLNHRIEPAFIQEVGNKLLEEFENKEITCVLTAEAAGNVVAYELARRLGVSALYAKKGRATTMSVAYIRKITSATKGKEVEISVSRDYLTRGERVLIVDDFLFRGTTSCALADMVMESGATLVGFGFVIAKNFGNGRKLLQKYNVPIVSLVSVESMDPKTGDITFGEEKRS